jgi:hypothetical protein
MKDTTCPAPDVKSELSSSPSGPKSASSTDSHAPHTNTLTGSQVNDLMAAQLQINQSLLAASTAMTLLAQSIQNLIEYGTRENDEEGEDYPTVGLDGRPIPRS